MIEPPTTAPQRTTTRSVHLADELVDVCLTVAEVSALDVVLELARPPAAGRVRQLERPEEVRRLAQTRSASARAGTTATTRTCLKFGPAVTISCTRSSTQRMSNLPSAFSMTALSASGMRCLSTLPYPRL
jgi:ethanolamine ammonia-lyase small subunit